MNGYEALRSAAAWIDLTGRTLIRVTGEDRARLLHAMSTNDISHLPAGSGVYAFFLNAQGRMLADANIYNLGESLFLDSEPELREKLFQHLDKYIIADDAVLADESDNWAVISLDGPAFAARGSSVGIPIPPDRYGVKEISNGFVARIGSATADGIRLFLPRSAHDDFAGRLKDAGIAEAHHEEARIVRLENAIPRYGEDLTERYLTGEAGVEHAIHPNKGCYLGQEIVERVRSRAQVHRSLHALRIHTTAAAPAGTKLQANGKDVAELTSSAYSPALGEVVALGYVRTEALHNRPEMVVAGSDPPISVTLV